MRLLVLGSCALFLCLPGYGQKDLKADLLSLSRASIMQVTPHLMEMSEKTHEPSGLAVGVFSRDLVQALGSRQLRDTEASALVLEINAVFKSAGTSTVGFLDHIAKFRAGLITVGVAPADADRTARDLETIGKQVRGPEDTPVERGPARRR